MDDLTATLYERDNAMRAQFKELHDDNGAKFIDEDTNARFPENDFTNGKTL